jgi:hypothetical protein
MLAKSINNFQSSFYIDANFKNKKIGIYHLKNPMFTQTIAENEKAYKDFTTKFSEQLKIVCEMNKDKLVDPILPKRVRYEKKYHPQREEQEDTEYSDEENEPELDDELQAKVLALQAEIQAKQKSSSQKKSNIKKS